ncbi:MAG: co-chaperone GroES [Acholeplasmatales bacterium]|jgi:chaperonin GroES|nr:co-chaperone GroES [Acholeplasmataceae bacterium]MDY0115229.1 co-chaperone GroES [Acholeplasmatales bacterium]MCK9233900.1 co-chaperone GroES [Acholeplasmataceae bacterium]MCK9289433.1 co-chaperone GroES [Acholeplasmataceae bacterium]MCK9427840.1 co-chaperone GroES [Acholeplasmataceae bacterium]
MIKPLKDYVVLLPEKEETKTESGIILTTDEKDKQSLGIVNNVGPEVKDLKKGDKVIYESYQGTKAKLKGEEYLIIKAEYILALISN